MILNRMMRTKSSMIIENKEEKKRIARNILEALTDWFGVPEAREKYISESADQKMVVQYDDGEPVGFLCLKETGKETVELHVMGVLKEYHRKGIGRALFNEAKEIACLDGYLFMQVKTVQMGKYPEYDDTNRFYIDCGFKEFELIPELWSEEDPCQIYVMYIGEGI